MGAVIGLLFGIGLTLCWQGWTDPRPATRRGPGLSRKLLNQAGMTNVPAPAIWVGACAAGAAAALLTWTVTRTWPLATLAAALATALPWISISYRAKSVQDQRIRSWPELIDDLISAVRAGMSLADALSALALSGPEPLRPACATFAHSLRSSGSFTRALDALQAQLADPVGDRITQALRIAHSVGGADLVRVLQSLARMVREDQRTRGELEARQSWTVNAARLAVVAPWVVVALICTNPFAAQVYTTGAGAGLLFGSALVSVIAYQIMRRVAALPYDRRVMVQ